MAEHTPTPWEAQSFGDGEDGVGIVGLRTNDGVPYSSPTNGIVAWAVLFPTEIDANDPVRALANAAFIVKACNSHQMLVTALAEAVRLLDALLGLERGSGEAALAFIEAHASPVGERL